MPRTTASRRASRIGSSSASALSNRIVRRGGVAELLLEKGEVAHEVRSLPALSLLLEQDDRLAVERRSASQIAVVVPERADVAEAPAQGPRVVDRLEALDRGLVEETGLGPVVVEVMDDSEIEQDQTLAIRVLRPARLVEAEREIDASPRRSPRRPVEAGADLADRGGARRGGTRRGRETLRRAGRGGTRGETFGLRDGGVEELQVAPDGATGKDHGLERDERAASRAARSPSSSEREKSATASRLSASRSSRASAALESPPRCA